MIRLLFIAFLLLSMGCERTPETATVAFQSIMMTIPYKVIIGQSLSRTQKKEIQVVIENVFKEIDEVYNKWNPHSEVSRFNQSPPLVPFALSSKLAHFLNETGKIVLLSEGRFDPTIEPLQDIWKKALTKGKIPLPGEIAQLEGIIGWDRLHFENNAAWKDHLRTALDLGGIAKGFAIDRILEELNRAGFHNVYVEWGGEIRTSGIHPEGRPWKIMVSKWGDYDPQGEIISLENQAIASSGDYLQNWQVGAVLYSHIFNPEKKCPMRVTGHSICSATVLAPTCMLADALATCAMLFDTKEEAVTWLEGVRLVHTDIQYWIYTR